MLAAKVQALLDDRFAVSTNDVAAVVMPVLRHRLVLNYHAQANALSADDLLGDVLAQVKRPYATD